MSMQHSVYMLHNLTRQQGQVLISSQAASSKALL